MLKLTHRAMLLTLFILGLAELPIPSIAQTLQIDALKANYLNGFIDFLRWEGGQSKSAASIGVVGSQQLVNHLNKIAGRKSNGRELEILSFDSVSELRKVDILFIAHGKEKEWPAICDFCRKNKILLVGEQDGFIESGGAIEFTVRKNRLRFFISRNNANDCSIEVSSKLIELALEDS